MKASPQSTTVAQLSRGFTACGILYPPTSVLRRDPSRIPVGPNRAPGRNWQLQRKKQKSTLNTRSSDFFSRYPTCIEWKSKKRDVKFSGRVLNTLYMWQVRKRAYAAEDIFHFFQLCIVILVFNVSLSGSCHGDSRQSCQMDQVCCCVEDAHVYQIIWKNAAAQLLLSLLHMEATSRKMQNRIVFSDVTRGFGKDGKKGFWVRLYMHTYKMRAYDNPVLSGV